MDAASLWSASDTVGRAVAVLLLAMSVATWVLIGWKSYTIWRVRRTLRVALPALWAANDWDAGRAALQRHDTEQVLLPLLDAARGYLKAMVDSVSPRSVAVIKRQIWDGMFQTMSEATAIANYEMEQSFAAPDFKEGVAHFLEKRAPKFNPL